MIEVQPIDGIVYIKKLKGSQRVWLMGSYDVDNWLAESKDNWSVKEVMDCSCKDESNIDIVMLMESDSPHKINVVHASINTKRCRTGW